MSIAPPEPMVLLSEDYDNNREENRQRLDELEERSAKPSHSGEKLEYDDSLDELIKLNIAFKTIHILGQVLRNFPGDIKKDLKIRMAEQSYMLGLRIMSYTLGTISDNSEALRYHFTVLLQERHIEGSVSVLGDLATKALLNVALSWILAIIKTLSHSVGMEDLAETYKEVAAIHGNSLSVDIIDTSIKLDHFGAFPATQLEKLHRRVRKNYLAFAAVRILLISHYRLYRTSAAVRDRFGKMYEIAATKDSDGGLLKENPLLEPAK